MKTNFAGICLGLLIGSAALAVTPALAMEKEDLLHDANRVVNDLRRDPAFGAAARAVATARAVYIVPRLVKGGIIIGAEGGDGVLLVRNGHDWSPPQFFNLGSGSFGFQLGLESAALVFIINSDRALNGFIRGHFKIGANAGITVVNLSSGAEGAITSTGGDLVVWKSGTGAYGGFTFNGSLIEPDDDLNSTPSDGPEAQALMHNLSTFSP